MRLRGESMPRKRFVLAIRTLMKSKIRSGFSLLEVMVALAITTLLILTFTPIVGQVLATWRRGIEVAGTVELWSRGLRQIRRDLRHAVSWTGYGNLNDL